MNKTYKDSQHYCINQLPVRHMLHHRHSQEECLMRGIGTYKTVERTRESKISESFQEKRKFQELQ